MNLKIPILVIIISGLAIVANQFIIDWDSIAERNINQHFDRLIEKQALDLRLWVENGNSDKEFRKRFFCNDSTIRWSDNKGWYQFSIDGNVEIVENENGIFLVQKMEFARYCYAISAFNISHKYSISNNHLRSGKSNKLPFRLVSVSSRKGSYGYQGLFFYELSDDPSRGLNAVSCLLIFVALIFIIWHYLRLNFYVSVAVVILARIFTLIVGLFESFIKYPLFDPLYYTSSLFNPTLGDLFINCLLVYLIALNWSRRFRKNVEWPSGKSLYPIATLCLMVGVSVFWVLWRILSNSQISLDVGQSIQFDLLRIVSYSNIILIVSAAFLLTFRLVGFIRNSKPSIYFYAYLLLAPLVFLFVSIPSGLVGFIFSLTILITSSLKWSSRLKEFKYENLQFALVISVIAAGILSFSVYKWHEVSELDAKKKFANHLLINKDVLAELYLNEIIEEMQEEPVSVDEQLGRINDNLLNPYFDKYDIEIIEKSSDSEDDARFYSRMTSERMSDYQNIYLYEEGTDYNYLCELEHFIISMELKKRVPTSVFPALLTDNKYFIPSDNFDYAVFKEGDILFQRSKFGHGEWPEIEDFNNEELYRKGIEKNERHYYGVQTVDGRVILIISKKYGRRMQLTNFSFLFLISLFFLGSIVLLSSVNFDEARLNFTGKIQLYLGLAFIIPLFTAGFALLNSLNTSYKEEINRNYLKRALYISELLSDNLGSTDRSITSQELAEVRDFIQADLSLYDSNGLLLATSQSDIFDLGLQSNVANPQVFTELIQKENLSMIVDESIGDLEYKVSYAVLNNDQNQIVGFIAMPFFDSKNHQKRQQLEVFGSLVSIFGLIFIIAIILGNTILNNLMKPLRMVADKISHITLQEENKPILYDSSDEIGSLVRDYNSMLVKLEQSKSALARSQKEVAWKEIARQVAHEIKNPLTPMQLKIQQLLRKSEEGTKDHETLSSLLVQVDTLSQIAESFSAFADMPAPDNVNLNFSKLTSQVVGLYQSEDVAITTDIEDDIAIHADKDIFRRILNNIVLNAIQSVENKEAQILVSLKKRSDKCELMVKDNGKGIQDELKDKIFLDYFSTKSSGSGIGLALAKKGIENAGGNIWFESTANEGTTFFISMPMVSA